MAVNDIVFCEGEIVNFIVELPAGSLGTPNDILTEGGNAAGRLCEEIGYSGIYPEESNVKLGINYGPTGIEFTGTYSGGNGSGANEQWLDFPNMADWDRTIDWSG